MGGCGVCKHAPQAVSNRADHIRRLTETVTTLQFGPGCHVPVAGMSLRGPGSPSMPGWERRACWDLTGPLSCCGAKQALFAGFPTLDCQRRPKKGGSSHPTTPSPRGPPAWPGALREDTGRAIVCNWCAVHTVPLYFAGGPRADSRGKDRAGWAKGECGGLVLRVVSPLRPWLTLGLSRAFGRGAYGSCPPPHPEQSPRDLCVWGGVGGQGAPPHLS